MSVLTAEIRKKLEQDILALGGFRHTVKEGVRRPDLGLINQAFPGGAFPVGAVHELLPESPEQVAASQGFLAALLPELVGTEGLVCWICAQRQVYPPALAQFGLPADRVIFLELTRPVDRLWALEEMLRCASVAAVVADVEAVSFVQSRRFQLAVEASGATGFLLRSPATRHTPLSTIASWRILPVKSRLPGGLPGVGFPGWRVELTRIRNGRPGAWNLFWESRRFVFEQVTGEAVRSYRLKKAV